MSAAPKASLEELDLSGPIELVVLAEKENAIRCRLLGSDRVVTLRAGGFCQAVPGEIVSVRPAKRWLFAGHPYLSGEIESVRIDVAALDLVPLGLKEWGMWDPAEHYWGEEDEPIEEWAQAIIADGPRSQFELEQVIPEEDASDPTWDLILESVELKQMGDLWGAFRLLQEMCQEDVRCLDAHAHLGNLVLDIFPERAIRFYEMGVRIGELSLGEGFDGVLHWGMIDNRPFLRCLHGYGLSLWRLERYEEAARVFRRMLRLNPSDNQGVRLILPDVEAGIPWIEEPHEDVEAGEPWAGATGEEESDDAPLPLTGEVPVDLKILNESAPWDWPDDTGGFLLDILGDEAAEHADRLLAAELAGSILVIDDDIAGMLLAIALDGAEAEILRCAAALSLASGLAYADMAGFDDPEDIVLSEPVVVEVLSGLRRLYHDADEPDEVRRQALEASARFPEEWHTGAVRSAYLGGGEGWKVTAVFCMSFIPGFEEEILEALESENPLVHYHAVGAAGAWEVDGAWWHVHELVTSPGTEKPLLLAAIEALGSIRPEDALDILEDLSLSEDEEIADVASDALGFAEMALSEDGELDWGEDWDEDWDDDLP